MIDLTEAKTLVSSANRIKYSMQEIPVLHKLMSFIYMKKGMKHKWNFSELYIELTVFWISIRCIALSVRNCFIDSNCCKTTRV